MIPSPWGEGRSCLGAPAGPKFAGHLTVVTSGCGTSCQTVAVVDAQRDYGDPPPDWGHPEYYLWDKGRLTKIKP